MKVHKMSNKQFAKFVTSMQNMALKNRLRVSYAFTDKYDYECRKVISVYIDWEIRRKLGGAEWDTLWALHNKDRKAWIVYEGGKSYEYIDSDLEKAVQDDG